jgi:hypothetical protein
MCMRIDDTFECGPAPYWVRFATGHADMEHQPGLYRFRMYEAEEGLLSDAELDDHRTVPRSRLPWAPPLRLIIRARMSHPAGKMLGTAGFGFWNDPFDWVGNVQVPPNAIWFFYASPQSDMAFAPGVQGHGWKAATLNAGRADPVTMAAGNLVFRLPGMSRLVFHVAQTRINASEQVLDEIAMTDWHDYQIDWYKRQVHFSVDGQVVLRAPNPPNVPLGFVTWMDNNYAVMGPGREFAFGRLAVAQPQWMELERICIEPIPELA